MMTSDPSESFITSPDDSTTPRQNNRKRNLVNQRNFRSRRKQYVEELEQRINSFEREGIVATQWVQEVARKLNAENAILRQLVLQRSAGWTTEDLDAVVSRALNEQHHSNPSTNGGSVPSIENGSLQSRVPWAAKFHEQDAKPSPSGLAPTDSTHQPIYQRKSAPRHTDQWMNPPQENGHHQNGASTHQHVSSTSIRPQPNTHAPSDLQHNPTAKTKAVMSCESAAEILADLRAQGTTGSTNVDMIRAELGCRPSEAKCEVPHGLLFERMDHSI